MVTEIIQNQPSKSCAVDDVIDNDHKITFRNVVSQCLSEHAKCTGTYVSRDSKFILSCSCKCHGKTNAGSDSMVSEPTDSKTDDDHVPELGLVKRQHEI